MFCMKCGENLPDGTDVCPACGAAQGSGAEKPAELPPEQADEASGTPVIPPPQIYINPEEPQQPPKPVKEKKKGVWIKVVAIVLLAAVLVSGVAVLSYFTFLPAKNTLQIARYFSLQKANEKIDATMKRQQAMMDAYTRGPVSTEGEISVSIDPSLFASIGGADAQTAEWIQSELKNVALRYTAASDIPGKKMNFSAGLVYKQNPALSLTGFLDDQKMGFSLPELSPKVITGEIKDLPRLAELFPDQFDSSELQTLAAMNPWSIIDLQNSYQLKPEDVKTLLDNYSKALLDSLDSGDMSISRGQTTDVLGKDLSCQEITVKLDQKAQKEVIVALLDTFKNDDILYDLIFGNLEKAMKSMAEANPDGLDMSAMLGRSQVKLLINQLKKELDEDTFPEEVTIKVYIKGVDIVKMEVSIPVGEKDEEIRLTHEKMTNGSKTSNRFSLLLSAQGTAVNIDVSTDNDYDKATDTRDVYSKISLGLDDGTGKSTLEAVISSKETPQGKGKLTREVDADISFDFAETFDTPRRTGKFVIAVDGDEMHNAQGLYSGGDYKVSLDLSMPDVYPQALKMGLAYTNTISYGEKVKLPDLSKAKVLDLKTATAEDFDAYADEINEKIQMLQLLFGGM